MATHKQASDFSESAAIPTPCHCSSQLKQPTGRWQSQLPITLSIDIFKTCANVPSTVCPWQVEVCRACMSKQKSWLQRSHWQSQQPSPRHLPGLLEPKSIESDPKTSKTSTHNLKSKVRIVHRSGLGHGALQGSVQRIQHFPPAPMRVAYAFCHAKWQCKTTAHGGHLAWSDASTCRTPGLVPLEIT